MNAPAARFQPQDPDFAARGEVLTDRGVCIALMQQTLMMLPDTSDAPE